MSRFRIQIYKQKGIIQAGEPEAPKTTKKILKLKKQKNGKRSDT
jgi:hypothetical protein